LERLVSSSPKDFEFYPFVEQHFCSIVPLEKRKQDDFNGFFAASGQSGRFMALFHRPLETMHGRNEQSNRRNDEIAHCNGTFIPNIYNAKKTKLLVSTLKTVASWSSI
jgi:hypothetical protein